jgi:hypothetical protein
MWGVAIISKHSQVCTNMMGGTKGSISENDVQVMISDAYQ